MIKFADNLWVGDSGCHKNVGAVGAGAVLNVACDLEPSARFRFADVEYAQVGLVDGPGNEVGAYSAAVLTLVTLLKRHKVTVVYCHEGKSRSVAVGVMYLTLVGGKRRSRPTAWSHWPEWDEQVAAVEERVGIHLPEVHEAHVEAYSEMSFGLLEVFL